MISIKSLLQRMIERRHDWLLGSLLTMLCVLPFSKAMAEICVTFGIALLLLEWGCHIRQSGSLFPTLHNRWVGILWAALMIAGFCSIFYAAEPRIALECFFSKWLEYLLVFWFPVVAIRNQKHLRRFLTAAIFLTFLIGLDALFQWIFGFDLLRQYVKVDGYRLGASFGHANVFAAWTLLYFFLLAFPAGQLFLNRESQIKLAGLCRFLLPISLGLLLFGLIFSYSRGAWLGWGLALFLGCVLQWGRSKKLLMSMGIIFMVLLVGLFLMESVRERFISIFTNPDMRRFALWQQAMELIRMSPLFGHGIGNYGVVAPLVATDFTQGFYAHNSYLQMGCEVGFVGLGLLGIFVSYGVIQLLLKLNQATQSFNRRFLVGLFSGFLAFFLHGFVDNHLFSLQLSLLFWVWLGLIYQTPQMVEEAV